MKISKNWDNYFLSICKTVAKNSKCLSRKIGSIIVQDKSILATGYNGPPRGVPHCGKRYSTTPVIDAMLINALRNKFGETMSFNFFVNTCPRQILKFKSGKGLEFCIAGHAERNALINAAREGIKVKGASLYLDTIIPCKDCLIEIINAGIVEIVCTKISYYDEISEFLVKNSGISIRTFEVKNEL